MPTQHAPEVPEMPPPPAEILRTLEADVQTVLPGIAVVSLRLLRRFLLSVASVLAYGLAAGGLAHFVGAAPRWTLFWFAWTGLGSLVFVWDDISPPLSLFRHNRSIAKELRSIGLRAEAIRVANPFGVAVAEALQLRERFALLLSDVRGA